MRKDQKRKKINDETAEAIGSMIYITKMSVIFIIILWAIRKASALIHRF